jgi:hypothetical protein
MAWCSVKAQGQLFLPFTFTIVGREVVTNQMETYCDDVGESSNSWISWAVLLNNVMIMLDGVNKPKRGEGGSRHIHLEPLNPHRVHVTFIFNGELSTNNSDI